MSFGKFLEEGDYFPVHKELSSFDAVILQYDTTKRAKEIVKLREEGLNLYIIYTNYRLSKHGPLLKGFDYPVDEKKTMVDNVCLAIKELFGFVPSTQSSLLQKLPLAHRKYEKRVLIHPESTREDKNWLRSKFLKLAKKLEKRGFEPVFILSPEERKHWTEANAPLFPTLEELATTVYESGFLIGNDSGPAHLASYYAIPHIIICQGRQMPLWSSGWYPPRIIRPHALVPNIKGMRLREKKWPFFIGVNRVLREFMENLWAKETLQKSLLPERQSEEGGHVKEALKPKL